MKIKTIHYVYIVPPTIKRVWRYWNKVALASGLFSPNYRSGSNRMISWPQPTLAPFSITRYLLEDLKQNVQVKLYDWFETKPCKMGPDDLLLFHPKPDYSTAGQGAASWEECDRNSVSWQTLIRYPDCRNTILIPYTHETNGKWLNELFQHCSGDMIAICGKYWTDSWHLSPYQDQVKRLQQVNMCIDAAAYPLLKHRFNKKNKRSFLYIGHTSAYKNTSQLEYIAAKYPGFSGGHIGYGQIKGWDKIASHLNLTRKIMAELAEQYDIFLNTSTADAQATTILEMMCFGFGVACTPQSGYDYSTIEPLHVSDIEFNLEKVSKLQNMDEDELLLRARTNRSIAENEHNWSYFSQRIASFIGLR